MPSEALHATQAGNDPVAPDPARAMRNLYFARFGFAVAWALAMLAATSLNPAFIALVIIYPLFDVATAIIDYRSPGPRPPKTLLVVNMALSLAAAIALIATLESGIPSVLIVWGLWAITAGIVQLIVAILRWRLGAQLAMVLSGGISALAGIAFVLMAGRENATLTVISVYAVLGGIFFLISAIRLHSGIRKTLQQSENSMPASP